MHRNSQDGGRTDSRFFLGGFVEGAQRALIPPEDKRHFLDVSDDIMERVDAEFFSDPMTAAMKALGLTSWSGL